MNPHRDTHDPEFEVKWRDEARRLRAEGKTAVDIAPIVGRDARTVRTYFSELAKWQARSGRTDIEDWRGEALRMWREGISPTKIARDLCVNEQSVRWVFNIKGERQRKKRVYEPKPNPNDPRYTHTVVAKWTPAKKGPRPIAGHPDPTIMQVTAMYARGEIDRHEMMARLRGGVAA